MKTDKREIKVAGRPAKAIRKEIRTTVRFSQAEHFIANQKASRAGMKLSVYMRQVVIRSVITSRLTEEERHFTRQLIGMANNLNQLAKCCHQEGALRAMAYFEGYRSHLDEILKKLKS